MYAVFLQQILEFVSLCNAIFFNTKAEVGFIFSYKKMYREQKCV